MSTDALFEGAFDPAETAPSSAQEPNLPARILEANRAQSLLRACDLDDLIAHDHRTRGFWQLLESADLASFDSSIKSVAGVGVDITNSGSDLNQIDPMLDRVKDLTGRVPREILVDGGFSKKHQIECAAARGVDVYAPTSSRRKGDPGKPRGGDGAGVSDWRSRMATPEAAEIYKERASTIELVFADLRAWRGMKQFPVRGQGKCLAVATLMALTFNFIRMLELGVSPSRRSPPPLTRGPRGTRADYRG